MTISENFGNGAAKTDDRFSTPLGGGYRPSARRESSAVLPIEQNGDDLGGRNGSAPSLDGAPIASSLATPKLVEPTLPGLGSLGDPVFAAEGWLDGSAASVADHPLLRGLLLELPPKGSVLQHEWLDRWFEAARSILELLYIQESGLRD
jgi:hypothetical protein